MHKKFVVFVVFVVLASQLLSAQAETKKSGPAAPKKNAAVPNPALQPANAPATPAPQPVDYYEMLKSTDAAARRAAVDNIGRQRNSNDAAVLIKALGDPDPSVRIIACDSLGLMREPTAIDSIIALLNDKEAQIRQSACVALGYIGEPKAIPALIDKVKNDADSSVKTQAILILGNMRAVQAVDSLTPLLKDNNLDIRLISIQALGKIGDSKAAPQINDALTLSVEERKNEKEPYRLGQYKRVITEAAKAAGALKDKSSELALSSLLKDDDKIIKVTAASALGQIGNSSGLDIAKEMASDKDDLVRTQAAEALGNIGDASAVPVLEQLYNKDTNHNVKTSAEISLYKLGWRPPVNKPQPKPAKKGGKK